MKTDSPTSAHPSNDPDRQSGNPLAETGRLTVSDELRSDAELLGHPESLDTDDQESGHPGVNNTDAASQVTINLHGPLPDTLKKALWVLSWVCGMGAAAKQYVGASGFFEGTVGLPSEYSALIGVVAALPPTAFYQASNNPILNRWAHWLSRDKQQEVYSVKVDNLPQVSEGHATLSKQTLADVVLGIGYGSANFGMVFNNFPAALNQPGLYELILATLTVTNVCVGIDKSRKVTDDIIELTKTFQMAEQEAKLLWHALNQYEKILKTTYSNEAERNQQRRDFKDSLSNQKSLLDVIDEVSKKVVELQGFINAKLITTAQNANSSPKKNAYTNSIALSVRLKATSVPGKVAEAVGAVFSNLVSSSAVVSNIGSVAALLMKLSTPIYVAYPLAMFASVAAFGLNKADTDRWVDAALSKYMETLKIQVGESPSMWSSLTISNILGFALSALQATAGVYFTKQALDAMTFLNKMGDYKWGVEGFCLASAGVVLTTTKAGATADWLRSVAGGIKHYTIDNCVPQPLPTIEFNKEANTYFNGVLQEALGMIKALIDHKPQNFAAEYKDYSDFAEYVNYSITKCVENHQSLTQVVIDTPEVNLEEGRALKQALLTTVLNCYEEAKELYNQKLSPSVPQSCCPWLTSLLSRRDGYQPLPRGPL